MSLLGPLVAPVVRKEKKGKRKYDVIIVGAGVAGLTAAIYAARYKLDTIILTKDIGGATATAGIIENYPGFIEIEGESLVNKFVQHVKYYDVDIYIEEVIDIQKKDDMVIVKTFSGEWETKAVILTLGAERVKLGVPGEKEFFGRGVSYCATCDAPLFKGKIVAVVGGGDTAVKEALHLVDYAEKVYLIHRRDQFRAEPIYVDRIKSNLKIELVLKHTIKELRGHNKLEEIILDDDTILKVDGLFVAIGIKPPKEFFQKIGIKTDDEGYVVVGPDQSTNIPGIFAAGDCTTASNKLRQIVTAAAEGAIAADSAFHYITKKFADRS
ncbi:MAG: NAD(P)/FAD-dependent oxidoreductase [Candidatus Asgardarchaeia archaeon]